MDKDGKFTVSVYSESCMLPISLYAAHLPSNGAKNLIALEQSTILTKVISQQGQTAQANAPRSTMYPRVV